jgi:predicted enzyme related to lactoylglutathione lyase
MPMRNLIVATTFLLTPLVGQAQTSSSKSWPADVGPGRVAWFDLTTKDLAKSKEFYGKLFGWQFNPVQGSDLAVEIVSRGAAIGTLRGADGQISAFNGVVYVQVNDIKASCARAQELGATLAPGFPFDLPNGTGAVGLVVDPGGHPLGLYSRTPMAATKP